MIKLRNIRLAGKLIECDIYPEDSTIPGQLAVDIHSGEIVGKELPPGYEWCGEHIGHARRELVRLKNEGGLPDERTIMWY